MLWCAQPQLLDILLTAAKLQRAGPSGMATQKLLVERLVQYLAHASNPVALADLRLHQLRAFKTVDAAATVKLAHETVAAALKVSSAVAS
jgi:hypothetical protein